ncbi:sensor histidine kinase [Catenuloplanes japonicus]|uniref:sensor histidine kinase n=1 Tax=Catenuloplanes japonicus TaxID=33876 RepID=UPI0005271DEF|nr:histidine kinase [Catenuloplanes japonicus]
MTTSSPRKRRMGLRKTAVLLLTVILALFDLLLSAATAGSPVGEFLVLPSLPLAAGATAIWLPRARRGSVRLTIYAILFGFLSVTVTVLVAGSGGTTGGGIGFAELLGLIVVLFMVARFGHPRLGWVSAGFLLFAIVVLPQRAENGFELLSIGLLLVILAASIAAVGVWNRFTESQRERQIALVRVEQRAEFARDLHDFIAHHVTGIVVQAQGARFIAEQDPQRVITALDQIEHAGAETMAAMRRMVGVLRSGDAAAPLTPLAGVADLEPLLEQFTAAGGAKARLFVEGPLDGLPVDVSTSAYRVVMEALTNVRRHAVEPTRAHVQLRRTPEWLFVRVTNDGAAPLRATDRKGYGLDGLGERVASVGGWLRAGPGINGGWVVDAALPIAAGEERQ